MKETMINMEKEIEQLREENKEKEEALIELSQFYYVSIYNFNIIIQYYKNKEGNNSHTEQKEKADGNENE